MATTDERMAAVRAAVEPALAALGLELFDVELAGSGRARTLRVVVDRDGGVDLDRITAATRAVSPLLDECAALAGPYLLEVSSPGVERPLRRPEHFRRALGATVSVRHRAGGDAQRIQGVLVAADDEAVVVDVDGDATRIPYDSVTRARTVFEWGPAPRPDSSRRRRQQEKSRS